MLDILESALEVHVFLFGGQRPSQNARLIEIEIEHGAIHHGGTPEIAYAEHGVEGERYSHIRRHETQKTRVEVLSHRLVLYHAHDQRNEVKPKHRQGKKSKGPAYELIGRIIGIHDARPKHRTCGKHIKHQRHKKNRVLSPRPRWRHHENKQQDNNRAQRIPGSAA